MLSLERGPEDAAINRPFSFCRKRASASGHTEGKMLL